MRRNELAPARGALSHAYAKYIMRNEMDRGTGLWHRSGHYSRHVCSDLARLLNLSIPLVPGNIW